MPQEILPNAYPEGSGGREIQMPEVRRPQESTSLRQFLCEDIQKELKTFGSKKAAFERKGLMWERRRKWYFLLLFLFPAACGHAPEVSPASKGISYVFEADEKLIFRALSRLLMERGFGEPRIDFANGRLETDYLLQGEWRIKAVATVKKIGRREREVIFSILTEQRDSGPSGWRPKKLMGPEQYEAFYHELEMQIYREWDKGK